MSHLPGADLLHHLDRGSQSASQDYQARLTNHQIQVSMSRTDNVYYNAVMERLFATLKTELVHRRRHHTRAEARTDISRPYTSPIFSSVFELSCRPTGTVTYVNMSVRQSENSDAAHNAYETCSTRGRYYSSNSSTSGDATVRATRSPPEKAHATCDLSGQETSPMMSNGLQTLAACRRCGILCHSPRHLL